IAKDVIARGDLICDPALQAPSDRIDATLKLLATETRPVSQWMPVRLHHAAAETGARIVLLGEGPIPPGGEGLIQLVLDQPTAAPAGDRFILRDTTAQRTIGGGRFLDLRAPARKRRTPERIAQLNAHATIDPERALAALLERPPYYADLSCFARDRAIAAADIGAIVENLGITKLAAGNSLIALSTPQWTRFKQGLIAALEIYHTANPDLPGIGIERLRLQIEPRLPAPAFLSALQGLAHAREIALDGAWASLPGHQAKLTSTDEDIWHEVQPLLGGINR